jgi:LacI family transcriptional regulator
VRHLLETGRRRVAFVGAGSKAHQVVDRLAGARQALVAAGRRADELTILPTPSLNVAGGVAAARALLDLPKRERPTGVTCVNDLLALGMLQELLRAGAKVPEDVAVIGYDDISFAEAAVVPLSSIRQPRHDLGQRAAQLLLDEATTPDHVHDRVVFEPSLVARESSA